MGAEEKKAKEIERKLITRLITMKDEEHNREIIAQGLREWDARTLEAVSECYDIPGKELCEAVDEYLKEKEE